MTARGAFSAEEQAANLLGSLSLLVNDRVRDAIGSASGQGDAAAAALSALHQFLDDPPIELLARVLGLTHSGTVRVVDRLEAAGLLLRRPPATEDQSLWRSRRPGAVQPVGSPPHASRPCGTRWPSSAWRSVDNSDPSPAESWRG